MDNELKRLINGLIDGVTCYLCDSPINVRAEDLDKSSYGLYITEYYCTGCDVGYDIEVVDSGDTLSFSAYRMDTDDGDTDAANMGYVSRKEALQSRTHPIRDVVESLEEIIGVLEILQQNKNRIEEAFETVRDEGFRQDNEFDRVVRTDLHNYLASSYSFEEIRGTVEPNLPTDGPVESALEEFDDQNQVIKGLRTYAQHYLTLPHSFAQFLDGNTGEMEISITLSMDDVEEYDYGDPAISFEIVEGDTINLERRINLHYQAAENLVREIFGYASSRYEDELEDYYEATSYDFNLE